MFQVNLALRLPAKGQMMQPPVDCHGTLLDLSLDDLVGGYENRGANPPSFTKYSPHMPESRKSKQTLDQIDQTLFKIQMSNAIQCQGDINWYHAKSWSFYLFLNASHVSVSPHPGAWALLPSAACFTKGSSKASNLSSLTLTKFQDGTKQLELIGVVYTPLCKSWSI